ncbi:hypothetical protein GCM10022237_03650 [Nocardioides ginsengisoli]|uniref:Uncharacterized protein n=1 Tax=Nocardioides ginsengisoli TaxID=363868 RepID=A0ABW3VWF6_9ACTN
MSEHVPVLVAVEGVPVPALLLKWSRERLKALVTLELEGHVETRWVAAEQVTVPD